MGAPTLAQKSGQQFTPRDHECIVVPKGRTLTFHTWTASVEERVPVIVPGDAGPTLASSGQATIEHGLISATRPRHIGRHIEVETPHIDQDEEVAEADDVLPQSDEAPVVACECGAVAMAGNTSCRSCFVNSAGT